jgi:hypothetical protein
MKYYVWYESDEVDGQLSDTDTIHTIEAGSEAGAARLFLEQPDDPDDKVSEIITPGDCIRVVPASRTTLWRMRVSPQLVLSPDKPKPGAIVRDLSKPDRNIDDTKGVSVDTQEEDDLPPSFDGLGYIEWYESDDVSDTVTFYKNDHPLTFRSAEGAASMLKREAPTIDGANFSYGLVHVSVTTEDGFEHSFVTQELIDYLTRR